MPKESGPSVVQLSAAQPGSGAIQLDAERPGDVQPDDQSLEARITHLENQVNQLMKVQQFSETQLLDALRAAKANDRLDFGYVSRDQMEAAVFKLSENSGPQAHNTQQ